MRPFSLLASVYDGIMSDVAYDDWARFMLAQLELRNWQPGPLLDLGCGTGNSTAPFVQLGYQVVGLDASAEMLAVARRKLPGVRFIEADFRDFCLPQRFALIYSLFDSLNNLLSPVEFSQMARCVLAHLAPGGFFIFDVNTTAGLKELWEAGRAEGWVDDIYYCWEHSFDAERGLARVEAYCQQGAVRFTEVHLERPYDADELRALLAEAGFSHVEVLSHPDGRPPPPDAARLWVIAQKPREAK